MANEDHVRILKQGVEFWNEWRKKHREITPDLSDYDLTGFVLVGVDFSKTDMKNVILTKVNMRGANLYKADLTEADLREVKLSNADLHNAMLVEADLRESTLIGTGFHNTDARGADFRGSELYGANFIWTDLRGAKLSNCKIFGISVWNIKTDEETNQEDLIITSVGEKPEITLDNVEVAQFIYLLLNNQKIRHVIDTITSKVVLILGRFSEEQKPILDDIRESLRKYDRVPVMFDFDKPANRDTIETIKTLAGMARFIIADITDPRSIPAELESIVKDMPSVPIIPLLKSGGKPYGMFDHIERYPWVLNIFYYNDRDHLLTSLLEKVIKPAEMKVKELRG